MDPVLDPSLFIVELLDMFRFDELLFIEPVFVEPLFMAPLLSCMLPPMLARLFAVVLLAAGLPDMLPSLGFVIAALPSRLLVANGSVVPVRDVPMVSLLVRLLDIEGSIVPVRGVFMVPLSVRLPGVVAPAGVPCVRGTGWVWVSGVARGLLAGAVCAWASEKLAAAATAATETVKRFLAFMKDSWKGNGEDRFNRATATVTVVPVPVCASTHLAGGSVLTLARHAANRH